MTYSISGPRFLKYRLYPLSLVLALALVAHAQEVPDIDVGWKNVSEYPLTQLKGSGVTIPPFYYWARPLQLKKGQAPFQAYLMREDGTSVPVTLPGEQVDPKLAGQAAWGSGPGFDPQFGGDQLRKGAQSLDEKWEVRVVYTTPDGKAEPTPDYGHDVEQFRVKNRKTGQTATHLVTDWGFGSAGYHFWDNQNDLFYTNVVSGSSTNRAFNLILVDPHDLSFHLVGNSDGAYFAPDRAWVAWQSGRWGSRLGPKWVWIKNLFLFNSKLRKNFIVTRGPVIALFNRWKDK